MIEILSVWFMLAIFTVIMFFICYSKDVSVGYKQMNWFAKTIFIIEILPIFPLMIIFNIVVSLFKKGS